MSEEMPAVQHYWRDAVTTLLKWNGALFLLIVAWSINHRDLFVKLFDGKDDDPVQEQASYGLLAVGVVVALLFPLAIMYIYKRYLKTQTDETVLPAIIPLFFSCALCVCTLTVIYLLLIG